MRHEVRIRTSNGTKSIILDESFCQSLRVPVGDNAESVTLFVASWIALLADSPLNPGDKPFTTYVRFLKRIASQGIKDIVVEFTNLSHKLVSQHSLMGSGSSIGAWIDDFKDTPVFFEYNRYYKTGDVKLLEYIYTFLNFGKKLEFVDDSFNEAAFRSWLDVEMRLSGLKLLPSDIFALKRILGSQLPSFSWRDLRPKFGPGAVQERGIHGRIDKLRSLRYDAVIDRFLLRGHLGMYGLGEDVGAHVSKIIPDPSMWTPARGVSSRSSRLRFVPKNLKTARSICMEPNTIMFFQQAVMRRFLELVSDSTMSKFIDIRSQERNKGLALAGSSTSEIDTLDLSAASDSVTLELVKGIFPASWLIPMLATRSRDVILPNGDLFHPKKFAPMGSAICFPTQCLIFASVCIYAACLYTYEVENVDDDFLDWMTPAVIARVISLFWEKPGYYKIGFQPLAVYGDDICVDRKLTDKVKLILSRLGFIVNESKSFVGSQAFRESCGGYYLAGNDITPLYFTVKGVKAKLTPSHIVSHVHLINESRARGYKHLYRFLHKTLMSWECPWRFRNTTSWKNSIPYVSDPDRFGIYVPGEVSNKHLTFREHPDYQRTEYRCWTISYDHRVNPGDFLSLVDSYEYMRWWASHDSDNSTEPQDSVSRSDTGGPGLRWRWIPAE